MVTESSAENRKVDKKTALALWETTVPPPVMRKKRAEDNEEDGDVDSESKDEGIMKFTLFTKRGNKQQVFDCVRCFASFAYVSSTDTTIGYSCRVSIGHPNSYITNAR